MRYSENTKKFWKLGYRLFGGQFVYFMSGSKNRNSVLTGQAERGIYSPTTSEINFAVPGKDILTSYTPYDISTDSNGRQPGIFTDMLESLAASNSNASYCLTFDGKKLKRGLKETSGDVDLLGCEQDLSLSERKCILEERKMPVNRLLCKFSEMNTVDNICTELTDDERKEISDTLSSQYKIVSLNICASRDLKKKKEYAKEKLIEKGGKDDWKNGKFVYAISATIAFIYDIDTFIRESMALNNELLIFISSLRKSPNVVTKTDIDLYKSEHYCETDIKQQSENPTTRQIKQRSEQWFDRRKQVKITGSSMYNALGLDGLTSQKEHFDVKVVGLPEKERSTKCSSAMLHGTENEINAAATMVGKVLPMMCPGLKMYEEGFIELDSVRTKPFMIISPDGSVRTTEREDCTTFGIELKCPIYDVHTSFPRRYLLQCLSEIEALNVPELLYLSWRPDISTCFRIKRNPTLFQRAFKAAVELYDVDKRKRPTKLSEESRLLSAEIHKACSSEDMVEFIGVFQSLKHQPDTENSYDNGIYSVQRCEVLLNQLIKCYDDFYELQRIPATEAVVFLCCDLDRKWEEDRAHSVPVCWFPKGGSLDTITMRKIVECVMNSCKEKGLYVPALSFDGQWHCIAIRDENEAPLTTLQLQKDVWNKVEKKSKRDIITEFCDLNKVVIRLNEVHAEDQSESKSIICTNNGVRLPKISVSVAAQRRKENAQKRTTSDSMSNVLNPVLIGEDTEINAEEIEDKDDSEVTHIDFEKEVAIQSSTEEKIIQWNEADNTSLLALFRVDKLVNAKQSWDNLSSRDISSYFVDDKSLRKLRDCELRIIVRYINRTHKLKLKDSDRKEAKVGQICKLLGLHYKLSDKTRMTKTKTHNQPKRLSELALKQLNKSLTKKDLNIIYAEYIWEDEYKQWQQQLSEPKRQFPVADKDIDEQFYYPSFSRSRCQLEVSCIDSSHLLTRTRRKSAKGGLDGFSNQAWRKVAKSKKTSLSIGMVDCITEPMTVSVANTHFSEAVENEMLKNGDVSEARLCRDIRNWWRAEDEPGISAENRISLRSALRSRLIGHIDFSSFPPPGMYVQSWPTQLWEAIIASIDAKRTLYHIVRSKTYHVRAFSSMMGETFFSEVTLSDRRGQGTITCDEFGKFMDMTIEKLHMRLDPKRTFSYRTSRKNVYQLVGQYNSEPSLEMNPDDVNADSKASNVRDHQFDDPGRRRLKSKVKEARQDGNRNAVARGTLPVRFENARRNESKLLPTFRLGLDMNDIT